MPIAMTRPVTKFIQLIAMGLAFLVAIAIAFSIAVAVSLFFTPQAHASENVTTSEIHGRNLFTDEPTDVTPGKKGTVLVFMSIVCPCSNSHVPVLKKIAEDFKNFNFVVVHSNSDEELDAAKSYFKTANFAFPVLQDQKTKLADEYKAYKTPHAFVISPIGKILYRGGVSNSNDAPSADKLYLRNALEDIEAGHEVRVKEGRTLGCVISRSES
jgi:peroxiredoxin